GARPDQLLTPEDVAQVHRAGKGLVIWHEERPEVIAGLRQRGVDAVCSDRPELLVSGKGRIPGRCRRESGSGPGWCPAPLPAAVLGGSAGGPPGGPAMRWPRPRPR